MPFYEKWNPVEIALLIAAFFSGLAGLFFPDESSRVARENLPWIILTLWYIGLMCSSGAILLGFHKVNYYITSGGYLVLGGISTGFGILILFKGETSLAYTPLITTAFGIAGLLRGRQLFNRLRQFARKVE